MSNGAMEVTHVSLRPTEAANAAGRPALTPELLAATGARYSRSDEGLEAILARIDPENPDKSVDSIFKMVDYGHQSIADMVPVALFMDGISLLLAYLVWSLCPLAGGQESSTRYIRMGAEGLVDAETLAIPDDLRGEWDTAMADAFVAYEKAVAFWEGVADANPDITRIPRTLLDDPSDKAKRTVARMRRNYAFDRARYFLPVAAKTNMMMVQSARAWVTLCQHLLSHPLPEAILLGERIRSELALVAPHLLNHATRKPSFQSGQSQEWDRHEHVGSYSHLLPESGLSAEHPSCPFLTVYELHPDSSATFASDLGFHTNRYAFVGGNLRRTPVWFGWQAVAFAEIRDLNRHRTGTKFCPLSPVGFYHAPDQLPAPNEGYATLGEIGRHASRRVREINDPSGIYFALLGTQFPFEHTTTADKFIYEAELRTGTGSHYRYAEHLRDALALWYEKYPATRGLILEGSAEPE